MPKRLAFVERESCEVAMNHCHRRLGISQHFLVAICGDRFLDDIAKLREAWRLFDLFSGQERLPYHAADQQESGNWRAGGRGDCERREQCRDAADRVAVHNVVDRIGSHDDVAVEDLRQGGRGVIEVTRQTGQRRGGGRLLDAATNLVLLGGLREGVADVFERRFCRYLC